MKLNLTKPLDGTFGDSGVRIVSVNAEGAQIVHEDALPVGTQGVLRFVWKTTDVAVPAEVQRTAGQRSGVKFLEEDRTLSHLIRESANELLRAQEANATGDREHNVIGDGTLTSASQGARLGRNFLIYELNAGVWKCRTAVVPEHPENGFAVLADESEEQIDMLCRAFESADPETRRLMRIMAQMSVNKP